MKAVKGLLALQLLRDDARATQVFMLIVVFNIIGLVIISKILTPLFVFLIVRAFVKHDLPYIKDEPKLSKLVDQGVEDDKQNKRR